MVPYYHPNARSRRDGSEAMIIEISDRPDQRFVLLRNEDADEWLDSLDHWEEF